MKQTSSHWFDCFTRDMEMMKNINSMMDFSYLAIGLRGSGCTRDEEDPNFQYPNTKSVYLSIQDPNEHAALNFGKSKYTRIRRWQGRHLQGGCSSTIVYRSCGGSGIWI